ncbi:MAG: serine/threonine-protein phosphatase [Anaerolineae bacterium]|nr:serine/threonine-protein phosphatase [Anaerolineae bacterium]
MNVFRRLFNSSEADKQLPATEPALDRDVELDSEDEARALAGLNGATRPLPAEEEPPALDLRHLMFGQQSDIGMVRKNNQDAIHSFYAISDSVDNRPGFGIFIVADGMGGHHDGEIAASIAARTVLNELIRSLYLPMLAAGDDDRPPIAEAIETAIINANSAVVRGVPEGGTTLTLAVIQDDLVCVGHVGDSRAYLIRGREAEQLTRDHSYVQRLAELGQIDAADASSHLIKNVLYRALGQTEQLEVDIMTRRLPPQSYLLLCSDGLWGQVKEYEIISTVVNNPNPQAACRELIARANASGGVDNVSAILIQVPG